MPARDLGFLSQSRTQLFLVMAAVVLFLVFFTQTSPPVLTATSGRQHHTSGTQRAKITVGDSAFEGNAKHANDAGVESGLVRAESRGDESSSHDTGTSLTNQAASDGDDMLVSSVLARHKAHGRVVPTDSAPALQQQAGRSTDTKESAFFNHSDNDQKHLQQSSKPEQPPVTASSHSNGSLNNAAVQSGFQPDTAITTAAKLMTADREDLLIVMPSSIDRMPIVKASRGWRQGVRTYIAFEEEIDLATAPSSFREGATLHNEVFGVCPDQAVTDAKWHKAGDLRATVAPFLANMTIGPDNFKWMLFGDDDTVFLIDNVLNLLPHLDPTVPYFMTDHLWYPEVVGGKQLHTHANRQAPRCLPCNYTDPAEEFWEGLPDQYTAPWGCPCSTTALCQADKLGNFGVECSWKTNSPGYWYFGHGGAGMLMSSALFRQGSYGDVVNWIWSLGDISSGDSMLMGVMHVVMGILPTDPGYGYFRPHIRLFDPGWHGLQVKGAEDENTGDNGNDPLGVLSRLEFALAGSCGEWCEDQLQHTISIHLRTRYLASELDEEEVSAHLESYEGSPDHKPAAYLHHKFQELWSQYNEARLKRSWFDVHIPILP